MSCIGLIRLVVCVLFTCVDRFVLKNLSCSRKRFCGDNFYRGLLSTVLTCNEGVATYSTHHLFDKKHAC